VITTKVDVLGLDGKPGGKADVPYVFEVGLRPDLIKRAFWLVGSHGFQPKGRDPMAGDRTTAETHSPPTGTGQSRLPRVKGSRYSRAGMAGGVASTVKGRLAHPPRSEKVIHFKINKKERRLATESAIAYTADIESVKARGHRVKATSLPLVVTDDIETVEKTAELVKFLEKAQMSEELARLYSGIKRNSGHARLRGRAYRNRVGPLFVVTNDRGLGRASGAIPGVDVVRVDDLNILDLAPGGVPGRLTLWTESSMATLAAPKKEVEMTVAA